MSRNQIKIGDVAVNSIVKFPCKYNSALYKVLEHKDGYVYLQEVEKEPTLAGLATLIVVDWFSVLLVEGF